MMKYCINLAIVVLAIAVPCFAQEIPIEQFIDAVSQSEKQLRNVYVESAYSVERWNPEASRWDDDGGGKLTSWLLGIPGSKIRVDFTDHRLRWDGAASGFSVDSFKIAYNGRSSQRLITKTGDQTRPVTAPRGEIGKKRPDLGIPQTFGTGWTLSIYGQCEEQGKRLSDVVKAVRSQLDMRVSYGELDGRRTEQVVLTNGSGTRTVFHYDPSRGHSFLSESRYTNKGVLLYQTKVENMTEPAAGVFYPTKAVRTVFTNDGKPERRLMYEASRVVANDPAFSDDVFTLSWPEGAYVVDKVADVGFEVGPREDHVVEAIDKQVSASTQMAAAGPSKRSEPATQPNPASSRLAVMTVVVAAAAAMLVGVYLRRRKTPRTAVLLCAFCGIMGGTGRVAQAEPVSVAIDELRDDVRVSSCGMNATLLALRYFGIAAVPTDVASSLKVGSHWQNPTSMADMRATLSDKGLQVEAYKEASLEDIRSRLHTGTIAVIHSTVSERGHYFVVMARNGDSVLIANPGVGTEWVSSDRFQKLGYSGYCLLVSGQVMGSEPYTLVAPTTNVDLGSIKQGQAPLIVPLRVSNRASVPLVLVAATGTCGCFKEARFVGAQGDSIPANSEGALELRFDRGTFGLGKVMRQVVLRLRDDASKDVRVLVSANVVEGARADEVRWFPESIDVGFATIAEVRKSQYRLSILLPKNVQIREVKSSSTAIGVEMVAEGASHSDRGTDGTFRTVQYGISLSPAVAGCLDERIDVLTTDNATPKLTIPVKGEIQEDGR